MTLRSTHRATYDLLAELPLEIDAYDHLAANGTGAYGGGQFELGPDRGQIQYLAALFHPFAPNDVAPGGFHHLTPGLPASPLPPPPSEPRFRWDPGADGPTPTDKDQR